jgi:hypothetical protein
MSLVEKAAPKVHRSTKNRKGRDLKVFDEGGAIARNSALA